MEQTIIHQIEEKYKNLGENPETYLKGLLQAKPINYWDYVEVDTLLSLQNHVQISKMKKSSLCIIKLQNCF